MAFGSVAAVAAGSSCVAACRSVGRGGGRGSGGRFGVRCAVGSGVGSGGRVAGSSLSRLGAPVSVSAGRRVGSRRLAVVSAVVSVRRRCLSCPRGRFRSGRFGLGRVRVWGRGERFSRCVGRGPARAALLALCPFRVRAPGPSASARRRSPRRSPSARRASAACASGSLIPVGGVPPPNPLPEAPGLNALLLCC